MNVLVRVYVFILIFTVVFSLWHHQQQQQQQQQQRGSTTEKGHLEIHELDSESQCQEVFLVQLT
jgi:hypothetical protein